MSLAILHSRASVGVDAPPVTVEVHLGPGLPGFAIVGLPEKAVQESKDRVRGALVNSAFDVPQWKVTVNLAPADLPKEGGRFDLPIAVGILAASRQIDGRALDRVELLGELALSGALRPVRGTLPAALATRAAGRQLLLPLDNAAEAALVRDLGVLPATHLLEVCAHLTGARPIVQTIDPTLNIAGDIAGTKNRCNELSIPISAVATATSARKGNMMRVSETVSSSLPGTSAYAPANAVVIGPAKTIPATTMSPVARSSALTTRFPSRQARSRPSFVSVRVNVGTNAALIAPSANRSRTRFGIRNAML